MSTAEPSANNEFLAGFLEDFFAECDEHLATTRRALLVLESFVHQPQVDRSLLDELFRSFHSLKGISAMVGVQEVEQLAHQMESYLRALRQAQVTLTIEGIDGLVAGTKMIEQVVAAYHERTPLPDIALVLAQLKNLAPETPAPAPSLSLSLPASSSISKGLNAEEHAKLAAALENGLRAWRFEFAPSTSLSERGVNVNSVRARLQELGDLIRAVPQVTAQGGIAFEFIVVTRADETIFAAWRDDGITCAPYEARSSLTTQNGTESRAAIVLSVSARAPSNLVRVELSRLDDLMRLVGELVIGRSHLENRLKLLEATVPASEWRALQETNLALERQLRDLREGIMRARMVPVGEIFERMKFVIRDLARESRKQVNLELRGQETEIDKFIVERMLDPLLHLVRNAISHGLESADERHSQGKPPEGRIALRAFTAGEVIVIEVEDDGRGIDAKQVAMRAQAMGLIPADAVLDQATILDLICAPGFSTREEVDRVSGRGVGMAVVRNTVLELGGSFTLDTEVGRGTRFTIELPLTLAIADALIVTVGGQIFAVPQAAVQEVMEIPFTAVNILENNEIITHRGGVLPLVRLARLFELEERVSRALYAFVVGKGLNAVGVVVDRILAQREIVVRAITDPLVQVPGIGGATELGDGRVVLILNTAELPLLAKRQLAVNRPRLLKG